MKNINLAVAEPFNERAQVLSILKSATPEGYTFDEVRNLLRVIDKIESVEGDGVLVLEDEEWRVLKARIAKVRWAIASHDIVALVDKINNAQG